MTILEVLSSFKDECVAKFNKKLDKEFDASLKGRVLAVGEDGFVDAKELYFYGTDDMTPGETPLDTGKIYFVYEE